MVSFCSSLPVVVNTWPWPAATDEGWKAMAESKSPIDAVVEGCTRCEKDQCDGTVGFGGSPDENGETTLDALVMNGTSMDVGSVGCLRRVKDAIKVARCVLENTKHTMLAGELATQFAVQMGFPEESLSTEESVKKWKDWKNADCQPNYRRNVSPDPTKSCGPYHQHPLLLTSKDKHDEGDDRVKFTPGLSQQNHDTIGMIAINGEGKVAVGTSTNGLGHKVAGRVGDSPIAGAGAYADDLVGGAVATGDGDVMMRFLPAFTIVEMMRNGLDPASAAEASLDRITRYYPDFNGAVVAVSVKGEIGAACRGFQSFHYCMRNQETSKTVVVPVACK